MKIVCDKRGIGFGFLKKPLIWIIFGVLLILFFMVIVSSFGICSTSSFNITDTLLKITPSFLDNSVQGLFEKSIAGENIGSRLDRSVAWTTNLVGYGRGAGQSMCLFVNDLGVGLLTGFWIWVLFFLYYFERTSKFKLLKFGRGVKNPWLEIIGRGWYKILLIGVGYAILMQIPFLNAAIDFVCFDFLVDGFWFDVIVRSILISFYIGVGPTAYLEYRRYKIKQVYADKVLRAKYKSKASGVWFDN